MRREDAFANHAHSGARLRTPRASRTPLPSAAIQPAERHGSGVLTALTDVENRLDGLTFAIQAAQTSLAILTRRVETTTALKQRASMPNGPGASPRLRVGLDRTPEYGNKTA